MYTDREQFVAAFNDWMQIFGISMGPDGNAEIVGFRPERREADVLFPSSGEVVPFGWTEDGLISYPFDECGPKGWLVPPE